MRGALSGVQQSVLFLTARAAQENTLVHAWALMGGVLYLWKAWEDGIRSEDHEIQGERCF